MKEKIINILKPYKKKFGYDQKLEWDKIALNHMENCNSILDIGCGEGRFISHNPEKIIGIDNNKKSLQICKNKGYSVKRSRATELPFNDLSFDAVHCSHVIEHLAPEEAHMLLKEMNRVLKIGGIFCIRAPTLHKGFYDDFTHIKPYNPVAILHYINVKNTKQKTFDDINGFYKILKLKYRRGELFPSLTNSPFWFLGILSNMLYRLKISSINKTGYILILKKLRKSKN